MSLFPAPTQSSRPLQTRTWYCAISGRGLGQRLSRVEKLTPELSKMYGPDSGESGARKIGEMKMCPGTTPASCNETFKTGALMEGLCESQLRATLLRIDKGKVTDRIERWYSGRSVARCSDAVRDKSQEYKLRYGHLITELTSIW